MKIACLLASAAASMVLLAGANAADEMPDPPAEAFPEARWGVAVGGFAGFAPAYEGSDEYRFVGYPLVKPKYYGADYDPNEPSRVDFRGVDDIRLSALRLGGLDVGLLGGYSFGREEDLSPRLGGLGNVDGGLALGGFAAYRFHPFYVDFAYHSQVTGGDDTGHTLRFGAGTEHNLSERMVVNAYVGGSYASGDYMDAYFSVTPAQAALSMAGLPVYDASSGFKDVGIDLGFDYRLTNRVTLQTKAGYSRLLGDAADSPITASRNQLSGGLGLTYTFGRTE